jgi:hypothetical protein
MNNRKFNTHEIIKGANELQPLMNVDNAFYERQEDTAEYDNHLLALQNNQRVI